MGIKLSNLQVDDGDGDNELAYKFEETEARGYLQNVDFGIPALAQPPSHITRKCSHFSKIFLKLKKLTMGMFK